MKNLTVDFNPVHIWWVLTAAAVMILMTGIDATAVNLILAPLSIQLHIGITKLQWIMNIYLLIYAACIVVGGRLGDCFGQKKIMISGLMGFILGSFFAALAHSLFLILLGRIIQGVGAAFISPNSMAIIYRVFPKQQKGLATGIITSVLGAAIAIGPFIGGLLTKLYSWRLVFLINLPLSLFAIALLLIFVHLQTKKEVSFKNVDLLGSILFGLFLFSLVATLDLIDNFAQYFGSFILLLGASITFLLLFIYIEKRSANPLINLNLLTNKIISIGCIIRFLYGMPIMTLVFVFALYLQHGLGYSTLTAGLMFLPLTIMMVFLSPFIGKLVDKIGSFFPLLIGIAISLLAYLGLSLSEFNRTTLPLIICSGLVGVGLGFTRPSLVTAVMKATPESQLGVVSSVFNMMNTLGGSIGIVIAGVILGFYSYHGTKLQLIHALPIVMYFCLGILLLTALLTYFGIAATSRQPRQK